MDLALAPEKGRLRAIHRGSLEQGKMAKSSWRGRRLRRIGLIIFGVAGLASVFGSGAAAGDAAGRYSILREGDKDTGCMLTLDSRARGRGGMRAQLAPACRDNGIVIFDPVGWGIDKGRLVLVARKGHKARFEKDSNGVWRRDASEGKALGLKPM
jgi:hypothetical protein